MLSYIKYIIKINLFLFPFFNVVIGKFLIIYVIHLYSC